MATSYILLYENSRCPFKIRKESVEEFLKAYSSIHIDINSAELVTAKAEKIILSGVKLKDAYHVASAILADCDYFLSTDDRLLKHKSDEIILVNPIDFLKILEKN